MKRKGIMRRAQRGAGQAGRAVGKAKKQRRVARKQTGRSRPGPAGRGKRVALKKGGRGEERRRRPPTVRVQRRPEVGRSRTAIPTATVGTAKEQFLEKVSSLFSSRAGGGEPQVTADTVAYEWAAEELAFDEACGEGDSGPTVQRIQEWLCLHGAGVTIDSDFGSATTAAVAQFQEAAGLDPTGEVDEETYAALTSPMQRALAAIDPGDMSYGELVVRYAEQHLAEHPREVGGENMGPWVRLYMEGNDGSEFPWCAGFACFVMGQAADTLEVDPPIEGSFSCDELAQQAMDAERFVSEAELAGGEVEIGPGALFLRRKAEDDWVHTGIVTSCEGDSFETIEGNTNDEGSREGYEVCRKINAFGNKDFVLVDLEEE